MPRSRAFLTLLVVIILITIGSAATSLLESLKASLAATDDTLSKIRTRWAIDQYPNFLKSAAISHTSWEVLKLKFEDKILSALDGQPATFVVSFMGSSVTAGHDSPFNVSFPALTEPLLSNPMKAVGIKVITRNAAMGNNPCMPYDLCPRTFSGNDADIVHWEQSYNCFGSDTSKRPVFEQFIRQSMKIAARPIVVFSESNTPNWKEEDCAKARPMSLSNRDKHLATLLARNDIYTIASDENKDIIQGPWGALTQMFREYKLAGIQMFSHHHYESYKCHGPYVKTWGCCAASWHPSLLGHEIRAAHYSFFWLHVYRDAVMHLIDQFKNGTESAQEVGNSIRKHIESEHRHLPDKPLYNSYFSDSMQCYTSFEPINDQEFNLMNLIIPSGDNKPPFQRDIMENFLDPEIIKTAKSRGYLDFKYVMYGNKDSSPLSLKISVSQVGTAILCQPPGNWGELPQGFKHFWNVSMEVYLTENVVKTEGFVFDQKKSKRMLYKNRNPKDSQTVCVDFNDKFPIGSHVLTLVPVSEEKVMISYLIVP